ncbi:gamma-glutamyltransferase [Paenibacillus xerothermodurans]|uniref:Glutathione hydrolase proenzyme n=1 Tax=Paenibacillus xerothermodurans TaxID=1977292 RepID=A0A2W1NGG1_PAEXE|nr:gamma-glutamyltransferase [Paenibacillus xerothermodurans]
MLKKSIVTMMTLFSAVTPALAAVPGVDSSAEGTANGIVAVSHPLAAEAGRSILQQGGNAVDAAAAIQLSLNVVEPMMSGIGGGGFMMIYRKDSNKIDIIDSREVAPANVTPKLFLDANGHPVPFEERHTNGKAVGVPGTLKGIETTLAQYGTMTLNEVIAPAIDHAEQGVTVNWATAKYIQNNIQKLQKFGTAANVFAPGGSPLKEGDLLVQPDLAKTLRLIKENGSDVLYNGEVGEALVAEVNKRGGSMTMDDMRNYTVEWREPVRGTYRGYEVASMSPPSSGGLTVLQILKLMEGYDVQAMGVNSADYLHRLLESMHLAYADRAAFMADEDFYPVPKQGLLDDRYINARRQLINPSAATPSIQAGDPWQYEDTAASAKNVPQEKKPTGQTTHFSVMDRWGNLVSYTTTIEMEFGSGIMVPGYGFMLNNEMTDFDAEPGGVNQVEPGKRPRSSMSPTLVLKDGRPFMAVGSPGGPTIIASVAQTILNVIDHRLPLQQAILTPRVYSSSYPHVEWEPGIPQEVVLELLGKGHRFAEKPDDIGNVQAVIFDADSGKMYGGADNTREGTVSGVDGAAFTVSRPQPAVPPMEAVFTLKVNGLTYPYTADQTLIKDGISYIAAAPLTLGLGIDRSSLTANTVVFDGQPYLPVRATAEALGYDVTWNDSERTVLLAKEMEKASDQVEKAYQEDKFKITR